MEYSEPWLVCHSGGGKRRKKLLAQDVTSYYVIDINYGLFHGTEDRLVRNGVSEALLKELKLKYERIPKSNVRGVAIGGWREGDSVYVYLNSGKRSQHILGQTYEQAEIDHFFMNVPRFMPPADKTEETQRGILAQRAAGSGII